MKTRDMLSSDPRRNPFAAALLVVILLYVGLLATPASLFAESAYTGATSHITVYSHHSDEALRQQVQTAEALVSRSSIDQPDIPQQFLLTRSHGEFVAFAPSSPHALGVTYPIFDRTILPPFDSATGMVHSDRIRFNERPLSAVIAHERVHTLLAHHFGVLTAATAPTWKQEGYCDYISGGRSVGSDSTGIRLLQSADRDQPAVLYFRDYLRVRYLVEVQHLTLDQIFAQHFETATLDAQAIAAFSH